jgi:broad specificity phosphatase PhoE
MKNVVLIRHGESLGQTATERGQSRKDPRLRDCYLSRKGIRDAQRLRSNKIMSQYQFDLVCSSPLSRALSTCVLGLGHIIEEELMIQQQQQEDDETMEESTAHSTNPCIPSTTPTPRRRTPFIVRADICEMGKGIPENHGRPVNKVLKDLKKKLSLASSYSNCIEEFDFSMVPASWPETDEFSTDASLGLRRFLAWLNSRPEENVAVVCHYRVIRCMLNDSIVRVRNCMPIECILTDEGELLLK